MVAAQAISSIGIQRKDQRAETGGVTQGGPWFPLGKNRGGHIHRQRKVNIGETCGPETNGREGARWGQLAASGCVADKGKGGPTTDDAGRGVERPQSAPCQRAVSGRRWAWRMWAEWTAPG